LKILPAKKFPKQSKKKIEISFTAKFVLWWKKYFLEIFRSFEHNIICVEVAKLLRQVSHVLIVQLTNTNY
jgi:hypothetical protein